MGSPRIQEKVIDGFLAVGRARRACYEVQVYDGETREAELIGDWEMPKALYMGDAMEIAVRQSRHESKRPLYTVTAVPEGEKFWVVTIGGLPPNISNTTQALREWGPQDIEVMARDFIALALEVDEHSFRLQITIKENEGDKA
jgi:hypothetical protein